MGKYNNIAKQLHNLNTSHKKSKDNDIFTCYYCPKSHHNICPHPTKCILNKEVAEVLIQIRKIQKRIWNLKDANGNQEQINRLILKEKQLFKDYYKIQTEQGGY